MATYPPLAQKRRERVPSQPCSLTAPAQAGTCCAWCGIWSHKDGPKRHTHRSDPGYPHFGPSRGAQKKSPKLSRLGELLNTQKNVHFLAPRAPRGPGAQNVHPGGYPLGTRFGPRGPGGPGGPKSVHFFGYLITLPVGTVFGLFFPPGDRGQIRGIPARTAHMGVSGAPPPPVIGLSPGPCPHHAQHARHGPVRLGSMAATGPASASSALVGGT